MPEPNANAPTNRTGVMIAFYLDPADAEVLALGSDQLPEGADPEAAEELHLTLMYLGKANEQTIDRETFTDMIRLFASRMPPVKGVINGYGRFGRDDGEGKTALYANLDAVILPEWRHKLTCWVLEGGVKWEPTYGFTPHITLGYLPLEAETPTLRLPMREVIFNKMIVAWGDDQFTYDLTGDGEYLQTPQPQRVFEERRMTQYLRAYSEVATNQGRQQELLENLTLPVTFIASTEGMKGDGKNLKAEDWILDRFSRYGVILFAHDYGGWHTLPIGTGRAYIEGIVLKIDVAFDNEDEFAMKCRSKAIRGMMAGSVGWDEVEKGNELLEFSLVPVPMDPAALPEIERAGLRNLQRSISQVLGDTPADDTPPPVTPPDQVTTPTEETRQTPVVTTSTGSVVVVPTGNGSADLQAGGASYVILPAADYERLHQERAGAMISRKNMEDLVTACGLIQGVIDRAAKTTEEGDAGGADDEMMGDRGADEPDTETIDLAAHAALERLRAALV